ncbi:universal stress protein [Hymenobacter sp. B81]|uniref:universal stress protein n=1 Tax=Hymenobacter sp. B81 TaxID=3344878 RepID=UPI0037DC925A
MDTLLVLTNLSPAAECARRYAAQLAGPLGARVVLLHVFQAPALGPEAALLPASTMPYDREQVQFALEQIAEQMLVPAVAEVVDGAFGPALVAAVARLQPRLLVLGLTSTEGYFEALLANRMLPLLRQGAVPVLLVPTAEGLRAPRRVVVGLDGEAFRVGKAGAELFQELLATWQARPVLACTTTPGSSLSRKEVLRAVQGSGLLRPDTELSFQQPLAQTPETGLLQAATVHQADLLVLLARRRSYLGQLFHRSVTARVLRRATQPVLLLPTAEAVAAEVPVTEPGGAV